MPGYSRPCRYCNQLVLPDATDCPACGKVNPIYGPSCPVCRTHIEPGWKKCPSCGLSLEANCPKCGKLTFLGDYCNQCQARLTIVCPNKKCRLEQAPIGDKCVKCGKPLNINK